MITKPTLYKKEYCERLIEHMSEGMSFEAFAGVISVTRKTLYNWKEKHEEFLEAHEIGIEKCRVFWERLGIQGAIGSKDFNGTAWIFNMKNRFRWRDSLEIEVNKDDEESYPDVD